MVVDLKDAKYIVLVDFGADNYVRGFANYEDAKKELDSMENNSGFDGVFDYYLVEVVEKRTIDHNR